MGQILSKGFTLIELLAVIIILAITALISPPLIMKEIDNVIKNNELLVNSKGTKVDGTVYIDNNIIKRAVLTGKI